MRANSIAWTRLRCFPALSAFLQCFGLLGLLLLAPCTLIAVEPSFDPNVADQLKQLNDQTILATHVSLDSEWNEFKHGSENAIWTLEGLWSWRVSNSQDWAIRLKLPLGYDRSDQTSDHAEVGGVGDVEIGTGTAFRLNKTWRTAGGIELHTDTASDPAFAENVWRLKTGWGLAHDVTNWLSMSFNADYNRSVAENHNVLPQSYLELSLPATLIFPQHWSVSAKYKTALDFENGDRWIHTVTGGVAKRLSKLPIVISASFGKPLSSGAKKFQASLTIVYYFERYHSPR